MNPSELQHFVTLQDKPDSSAAPTVFSPPFIYVGIKPSDPGAFDEDHVVHIVTAWYHPQITTDTYLLFNGRYLWVKGVKNVDESNIELVLFCEEVKTP